MNNRSTLRILLIALAIIIVGAGVSFAVYKFINIQEVILAKLNKEQRP
jgi:hypothetical protein